ncbi:Cg16707-like protein [Lasiodiplodia theobromae]|uniref:Cg16707-like protein n=1 Tax=Lasiodiplodia theobromae TaxID=45133 RepID=UPI0015C38474|nr:Cg16707-like protein [Lasiodiplodia theobromae]KAF4536560.1 Cg16707-like protein [Lasiodiplodia theobromae]
MAVSTIKPGGAGPLTTVFTTPDFCAANAWTDVGTPALSSSICMPNGFTEYWNYKAGFFSPGICPLGFTRGCSIPADLATGISLGGPLSSGETGQICCPTSTALTTYTTSNEITPAFLTTTLELVYAIQVRWRESDLTNLETNPTVYGQTMTASATASAAARTTATATSTSVADENGNDSNDTGLSTGAQIGIIVGVVAAVIGLAIGAYLLWRRRSDKKRQPLAQDDMKPGDHYQHLSEESLTAANNNGIALANSPASPLSPENMASAPSTAMTLASEMPASTAFASEMQGSHMHPVEAPASNSVIAELPGDHAYFEKDTEPDGKR